MAKRTVKAKPVPTLGSVFLSDFQSVRFTFASKLARLTKADEMDEGYRIFDRHLKAGNFEQCGTAGYAPGQPLYRVANPDAPAI